MKFDARAIDVAKVFATIEIDHVEQLLLQPKNLPTTLKGIVKDMETGLPLNVLLPDMDTGLPHMIRPCQILNRWRQKTIGDRQRIEFNNSQESQTSFSLRV